MVIELLCYIQKHTNHLAVDIITRACIGFYSPQQIAREKEKLYNNVITKQRMIRRQGDNKAREDVRDMIKIFLEL